MSDVRVLDLDGMKVEFRLDALTSSDLDDLQEMIAIFRKRFDRQSRAYDPQFMEVTTGCLDAPLP